MMKAQFLNNPLFGGAKAAVTRPAAEEHPMVDGMPAPYMSNPDGTRTYFMPDQPQPQRPVPMGMDRLRGRTPAPPPVDTALRGFQEDQPWTDLPMTGQSQFQADMMELQTPRAVAPIPPMQPPSPMVGSPDAPFIEGPVQGANDFWRPLGPTPQRPNIPSRTYRRPGRTMGVDIGRRLPQLRTRQGPVPTNRATPAQPGTSGGREKEPTPKQNPFVQGANDFWPDRSQPGDYTSTATVLPYIALSDQPQGWQTSTGNHQQYLDGQNNLDRLRRR